MNTILQKIDSKKTDLDQHLFCQWLSKATPQENVLAFAPAMSYFVLGFRDILELARFKDPQSPLEHAINHHCDEDSEHWQWYLNDLTEMGFLASSAQSFLYKIWSDEQRVPRNMVYFLTHLIQTHKDPAIVLAIIECLEAAFAVFIERLRPQLVDRNLYQRLTYFGMKHDHGEQSHAMGSWIEDGEEDLHLDFAELNLSQEQEALVILLVDQIFAKFDELFTHWHQEALSSKMVNLLPLISLPAETTLLET